MVSASSTPLSAAGRTPQAVGSAPRVCVCVVTYRRPVGLARLLTGIGGLQFRRGASPTLEVVVVDNDSEQSAEVVCASVGSQIPWPVRYEVEPRRGIPMARNAAVRSARSRSDFVAFIDDDEEPDQYWLDELLHAQRLYGADVVSGPVVPRFEAPPPAWVREGEFFERVRYATGGTPRFGATNNVLVRTALLEGAGGPFDERLALAGGEDTHFFLRVARSGYRHVWADEAVVEEWLPPTRVRAAWILRRAYRKGISIAFCERDLERSYAALAGRAAKAVGRIVSGVVYTPVAALRGRATLLRTVQHICYGAGGLAGMAGMSYDEYRVTHGR
jgi:succinoglycan biosynthesis protein ExoM